MTDPNAMARDLSQTAEHLRPLINILPKAGVLAQGKGVVVVTGANRGIGLSMVGALLRQGFRVGALDASRENLLVLQERYPNLLPLRADIALREETEAGLELIVRKWGRIDVLVNLASLVPIRRLVLPPEEDTRRNFEVNVFAPLRLISWVLPQMEKQGFGIIHNVCSGFGIAGFPGSLGTAASQAALASLSRTLDLGMRSRGVRVNVMIPPFPPISSAAMAAMQNLAESMVGSDLTGERLARSILSTKPVITPDMRTTVLHFLVFHFPFTVGKLISRLAASSPATGPR
jgi:NAD(P)-dependent dehydrogenase (short-subunit alcohol dehydrogenase family)